MPRPTYSFGEPNWETIGRWLELEPADDGPVWMFNLMKYRAVASYGGKGEPARSGKEADDAYAPLGPLAAVGATVALFADVSAQLTGDPAWDRIAMVRYPTRSAFFKMQERDDYKEKFVHKEAGMEFTIIMGCLPDRTVAASSAADTDEGDLVVRARRFAEGAPPVVNEEGVVPVARFTVDGVVLGDARTWDEVRVDRVPGGVRTLAQITAEPVAEQIVCVVDARLDHVAESILSNAAD